MRVKASCTTTVLYRQVVVEYDILARGEGGNRTRSRTLQVSGFTIKLHPQENYMIARNCNYCQQEYQAEPRYLNRGQGIFCSRSCSTRHKNSLLPDLELNAACAYCNTMFHKPKSKKHNSRSGLYFCCREHKDLAQRIGGIKEIQPPHYGETLRYRPLALRTLPKQCVRCGWDKIPEILEVNHIDCDRSNNDITNLEILCPTCHREYHFVTKTGYWQSR